MAVIKTHFLVRLVLIVVFLGTAVGGCNYPVAQVAVPQAQPPDPTSWDILGNLTYPSRVVPGGMAVLTDGRFTGPFLNGQPAFSVTLLEPHAYGDLNGDGVMDLVMLNPVNETLTLLLGDGAGFSPEGVLDLKEENLSGVVIYSLGRPLESLAAGRIFPGNTDQVVVRVREEILVADWRAGKWQIITRVPLPGLSRAMKGVDLDRDGDMDLLAAVRIGPEREHLLVFRNEEGRLTLIQTIPTGLVSPGDYPVKMMARDFNGDGMAEVALQMFSDTIRWNG